MKEITQNQLLPIVLNWHGRNYRDLPTGELSSIVQPMRWTIENDVKTGTSNCQIVRLSNGFFDNRKQRKNRYFQLSGLVPSEEGLQIPDNWIFSPKGGRWEQPPGKGGCYLSARLERFNT
jgi:hypothetical protein